MSSVKAPIAGAENEKKAGGLACVKEDTYCGCWCFPIRAGLAGRITLAPNGKLPEGVSQKCLDAGQSGASTSVKK